MPFSILSVGFKCRGVYQVHGDILTYFEEGPKTRKQDFFNYSEEFARMLSSLVEGRRMILVKGRRRTGKTSMLLSCLNEFAHPYLVIDGRAFSASTQVRREEFIKMFEDVLNGFLRQEKRLAAKILDALKHVQGVELSAGTPPGLSLRWGPRPQDAVNIASIFDALSTEAVKQKTTFVVALDEAQELRKIMRYDFTSLLAHAYDYCRGLQFVVTGSEVGMLNNFLRVGEPSSPMYGRAMVEIELRGMDKEKSIEYLRCGFKEMGMRVSNHMVESICHRFDGIIGWLTYAGFKAREVKSIDEETLDDVARKASGLAAAEFKNFLNLYRSERYSIVMKHLARGGATWSEIKKTVEVREGVTVGQGNITKLLSTLEDAGFIAKGSDGLYSIIDPILAEAAKHGLI